MNAQSHKEHTRNLLKEIQAREAETTVLRNLAAKRDELLVLADEALVNPRCRFDQPSNMTKSTAEPSPPEPLPLPVLSLSEESPTVKCGATSSAALPADQVEPGGPKPDSLALQSLSDAVLAQTEANRDTAATLKVMVEESKPTIPIELVRSNSQALMAAFQSKRGRPRLTEAEKADRAERRARYVHEFVNSVLVP